MRKSNEFISTLAKTGVVLNLISGGMSKPVIKLTRFTNAHQLEIKVPGVDVKKLSIEITNSMLSIYQIMEVPTAGHGISIPRSILNKSIPHFINVNGIEAGVKENKLLIRLPFNERADGYQRKLKIREL